MQSLLILPLISVTTLNHIKYFLKKKKKYNQISYAKACSKPSSEAHKMKKGNESNNEQDCPLRNVLQSLFWSKSDI